MRRSDGMCGRRSVPYQSNLIITAMLVSCLVGLLVGCANDPYSQRRIALRKTHIQETIQAMDEHEAGGPQRIRNQLQNFRKSYRQDEKMFQERMRTAGNNIW